MNKITKRIAYLQVFAIAIIVIAGTWIARPYLVKKWYIYNLRNAPASARIYYLKKLTEMRCGEIVPDLISYFNYDAPQRSIGTENFYRRMQIKMIVSIGKAGVPRLASIIDGNDEQAKLIAIEALSKLSPYSARAVPALINYIKNSNSLYLKEALAAIKSLGPGAKECVPTLLSLIPRSDKVTRCYAYDAIGAIGKSGASEATQMLLNAIKTETGEELLSVASALEAIEPGRSEVVNVIINILKEPNMDLLPRAVELLLTLKSPPLEATPILFQLFSNSNSYPSIEPISRALSRLQFQDFLTQCKALAASQNNDQQWKAAAALGSFSNGTSLIYQDLLKLIQSENIETSKAAIRSFGYLRDLNEELIDKFINTCESRRFPEFPQEICRTLADAGICSESTVAYFANLLYLTGDNDDEKTWIARSLLKLARHGQNAKLVLAILNKLINNEKLSPNVLPAFRENFNSLRGSNGVFSEIEINAFELEVLGTAEPDVPVQLPFSPDPQLGDN